MSKFGDISAQLAERADTSTDTKSAAPKLEQASSMFSNSLGAAQRMDQAAPYKHAVKMIDPGQCYVWEAPERNMDDLTETDVSELMESIRSIGRVERPLVARAVRDQDGVKYEIVSGRRRYFAVSLLHKQGRADIKLPIEIRKKMTDVEAFIASDAENKGRDELCDLDRARKYRWALDTGLYNSQSELSQAVGLSDAMISRLLKLSELPTDVVGSYERPSHIKELWARDLFKATKGSTSAWDRVKKKAAELSTEQGRRRKVGEALIPNNEVNTAFRLSALGEGQPKPKATSAKAKIIKAGGKPLLRVKPVARKKLPLEIHLRPEIGVEETIKEIRALLEQELKDAA